MGFLELQRQCGVSHEVLRGAQGASHVALGKSGHHAHCEGERVIALESWKVYRASRTVKEANKQTLGEVRELIENLFLFLLSFHFICSCSKTVSAVGRRRQL